MKPDNAVFIAVSYEMAVKKLDNAVFIAVSHEPNEE